MLPIIPEKVKPDGSRFDSDSLFTYLVEANYLRISVCSRQLLSRAISFDFCSGTAKEDPSFFIQKHLMHNTSCKSKNPQVSIRERLQSIISRKLVCSI
jgi:hypothetical protein